MILGDPFTFHPVIVVGKVISFLEKAIYKNTYINGLLLYIVTVSIFVVPLYIIHQYIDSYVIYLLDFYIIYSLLATKSLYVESKKVLVELEHKNLKNARKEISYLVSRDTDKMTEKDIYKALAETISENTIDGILAPIMFVWFGLFFQMPVEFLVLYKITSTLDSMVGYKNEKYKKFGFVSAKMDDLLNIIPSRLGSILMVIPGMFVGSVTSGIKVFIRDRKKSKSPNAAHPESMIAGLLEVELLGDAIYFGEVISKESIGVNKNKITSKTIHSMYFIMFFTAIITMMIGGTIYAVL